MVFWSAPANGRKVAGTAEPDFAAFVTTPRGAPLSAHSLKPFRQVRFSLHTHLRFCLALTVAIVIAGGGFLFTTGRLMRHSRPAQPVMANPTRLVRTKAAAKEARLVPAGSGDQAIHVSRRIDIAEGLEDGAARLYTYQHVVLDLRGTRRDAVDNVLHEEDSSTEVQASPSKDELERGVPINVSLARPDVSNSARVHEIVVAPQSREKLGALLHAAGIAVEDSQRLEAALGKTELNAGDRLELLVAKSEMVAGSDGQQHVTLARFEHGDVGKAVYGRADDGVFRATGNERLFARLSRDAMLTAYHPQNIVAHSGSIPSRLKQAGAPDVIVGEVEKLASQNNIALKGLKTPDFIDLLFRKSADTKPELVFVEFMVEGKSRRLYRHEGNGGADYFNEDGSSMTKYLMPKPLPNGRLNDGFGWRIHPVLHVRKHHNGVDYDAPIGSPIVAAGDGVVELISYQKGYGKYVRIRHQGGYSTTYAHLSAARKGLKVGEHVTQGEVIAYVGSTGYSTGPHLYYELKVGDQYVDPLKARLNAGEKLTGSSLSSFREEIHHVDQIVKEMKLPVMTVAPETTKSDSGKDERHQ